ncbi:MAG: hypothetical protein HOA61_01260 [Bacteroidetes bacterium]|nr:hypothetical protein [Bacteroidota bacterium]
MKAIPIHLIWLIILLQACSKDPYDYENDRSSYFENGVTNYQSDSEMICLTYNIQLGFKAFQDPWNADEVGGTNEQLDNIVQIIDSINPVIIALQEVPLNRYNTAIEDYVEALADKLHMNFAFGSHGYNDPMGIYPVHGEWGNAILSKYEIIEINNIQVSYLNKWAKRSILDVRLKINDSLAIHVISLHFGLTSTEYNNGLINTINYLKTISEPCILMGDFNPQFGLFQLAESLDVIGLKDSDSTFLHAGDRIFYSEANFSVGQIGSLYDTINWTSDHPANFSHLKIE